MNHEVEPAVRQLVQQHGAAFYGDARRCEAFLRDVIGGFPTEISIPPTPNTPPYLLVLHVGEKPRAIGGDTDVPVAG